MLDPAIRHEEVRANGLRFHVLAAGEGDRLALCLHGFPELGFSWRHQLPLLASLGYRAWAPDLRGYGRTERPTGIGAYAIETLMDDVAGLVDASGAKQTVLLAHDWGGVIAWYFALRRVRPLSRFVAMNLPHPAIFDRVLRTSWRQRFRSWYVLFFQLPWLPELFLRARGARAVRDVFRNMAIDKSRFPDDVLDVYRRAALEPGAATAMLNYYRALVRGGGANRQRALGFPQLDVPTLLIWGEHDDALDITLTEGTEEFVRDFTLRRLPNASHWVQQDAPEEVNAILREWLGKEREAR